MKRYSMIHGLLAAALAVNLALPVTAAGTSSFTDVSDSNTALNADILRLMGVVSGTGGNQFNPNQVLTRAQFCTMAVNFIGSFCFGLIFGLGMSGTVSREWRLALTTGFCGGLTTFSTFSFETLTMLSGGQIISGLAYAVVSLAGGILAAMAGYMLTR